MQTNCVYLEEIKKKKSLEKRKKLLRISGERIKFFFSAKFQIMNSLGFA